MPPEHGEGAHRRGRVWGSICSPSPGTSCTRRKASGRFSCAAGWCLSRSSTARATKGAAGPAPRTCPGSWGSAPPARSAAAEGLDAYASRVRPLRDRLHELLAAAIPGLVLNGHPEQRLPNTLNVSVPGGLGQPDPRGLSRGGGLHRLGLPRRRRPRLGGPRGDGGASRGRPGRSASHAGAVDHGRGDRGGGGGPGAGGGAGRLIIPIATPRWRGLRLPRRRRSLGARHR